MKIRCFHVIERDAVEGFGAGRELTRKVLPVAREVRGYILGTP